MTWFFTLFNSSSNQYIKGTSWNVLFGFLGSLLMMVCVDCAIPAEVYLEPC